MAKTIPKDAPSERVAENRPHGEHRRRHHPYADQRRPQIAEVDGAEAEAVADQQGRSDVVHHDRQTPRHGRTQHPVARNKPHARAQLDHERRTGDPQIPDAPPGHQDDRLRIADPDVDQTRRARTTSPAAPPPKSGPEERQHGAGEGGEHHEHRPGEERDPPGRDPVQVMGRGLVAPREQSADLWRHREPDRQLQQRPGGDQAPDRGVDARLSAGAQHRQQDHADPHRGDVEDRGGRPRTGEGPEFPRLRRRP